VLLGCGVLLGFGQLVLGSPQRAWPDLALVGVSALVPLVVATRVVKTPGVAAAVCGAYLLPRTLISLVDASIEPPPLLLVPALAFDLCAWLRSSDLANVRQAWPRARVSWRKRARQPRRITLVRGAIAGATFGIVWSLVEPPYAILLGADPSAWSGPALWWASAACVAGCAAIGSAARDRGW
jgi:hypothetical protein